MLKPWLRTVRECTEAGKTQGLGEPVATRRRICEQKLEEGNFDVEEFLGIFAEVADEETHVSG